MSIHHLRVWRAIKSGELVRQSCEVCGNPDTVAHHDDYRYSLQVRWLCHPHHRLEHERLIRLGITIPGDYFHALPKPRPTKSLRERFMAKVDRTGRAGWEVFEGQPCWLWQASLNKGYGQINSGPELGNTMLPAHRVAWELFVGEITEGLELDHLCRVPRCVNPKHLEPVTPQVNQLRGITLAAINAATTHCPKGHPYSEWNTAYQEKPNGRRSRYCKTCNREKAAINRGERELCLRSLSL